MTGSLRHTKGALIPEYTTLTDATATVVFTARKVGSIMNQVMINNPTGSAVTVVVDVHDGTSVLYEIDPGKSVTTTAKVDIDGWPMMAGHTLRVTAANLVQVAVSYYQSVYESLPDTAAGSLGQLGQGQQNTAIGNQFR